MANPTPYDPAAFQSQVEQLAKIAATSTDECVVATLIAAQNKQVQERVAEKAKHYVWKGLFCDKREDGKIAVVFNFECHPGQICLVKPWFAAVVDLEFGTVYGIQDPYRPETSRLASSTCDCTKAATSTVSAQGYGCDTGASVYLKNVTVDGGQVNGQVWAKLYVNNCPVVGTVLKFEGDVFDFTVDRNGGSVSKALDVGCAHLSLRVFVDLSDLNNPKVCVHWDITGCKVKLAGRTVFGGFDEHAQTCAGI